MRMLPRALYANKEAVCEKAMDACEGCTGTLMWCGTHTREDAQSVGVETQRRTALSAEYRSPLRAGSESQT